MYRSGLTVVFGAGHPAYDDEGKALAREDWDTGYCSASVYEALAAGTTGRGWELVETREAMEALAAGETCELRRVFGLVRNSSTLQYRRDGKRRGGLNECADVGDDGAGGAERAGADEDGFFLMVEGGAIDWANHDKNLARMVEEFGISTGRWRR